MLDTRWLLVLALGTPALAFDACQEGCICDDVKLTAICDNAGLMTIPIFLNPRIESLSLRNNLIDNIPPEQVRIYSYLKYLDLSHNQVKNLKSHTFEKLSHLRTLKLNNNGLNNLHQDGFKGLSKLTHLDMSHNTLYKIGEYQFQELAALTNLNLSYNELTEIAPLAFDGLTSIETIDAHQNLLSNVPVDALHATGASLKTIDLSYNRIEKLAADTMLGMTKLETADFRHNRVDDIELTSFIGASSLHKLYLSHNQLSTISPAFGHEAALSELRHLDLSANRFSTIRTSSFDGLPSLQRLELSQCPELQKVELNAFAGLYALTSLDLSENRQLVHISENAFEHPNELRRLVLRGNSLTTLPRNILNWVTVDQLDLRDNPWRCDCSLNWMTSEPRMTQLTDATCATPDEQKGQKVTSFSHSCNGDINIYALLAILSVVFATLLIAVIVVVCCCQERFFGWCSKMGNTANLDGSTSVASSRCSPYSDVETGTYYIDKKTLVAAKNKTVNIDELQYMQYRQQPVIATLPHRPMSGHSMVQVSQLPPRFNTLLDQHHQKSYRPQTTLEEPCYASIPVLSDEIMYTQAQRPLLHNNAQFIHLTPGSLPPRRQMI